MTFRSAYFRIINYLSLKILGGAKLADLPDIKYRTIWKLGKMTNITIGKHFVCFGGTGLIPLSSNRLASICVEDGAQLTIGDNVGMSSPVIWAKQSITIGNGVTIGANAVILDSDCHSLNYKDRGTPDDMKNTKILPVVIEDDVLIGTGAYILKGVTIGARSVIGAGSVVTKDIPSDCIAAGNPCKVLKRINGND